MSEIIKVDAEIVFPAAQFTATGWTPNNGLSYDDWRDVGRRISLVGGAVNWWIGDWINYGSDKYGEKYAQALEVFDGQYEYSTLRKMAYLSSSMELFRRRNNLSWAHHMEVAKLDEGAQSALLDFAEQNHLSRNDLRIAVRDYERNLRLVDRGADIQATTIDDLPAATYRVIYADPPWQYDNSGFDQSAEEHYPTMTIEELCSLPVGRLADEPCALYMWATVPLMPDAFRVMEAWGFEYKSHRIWVKNRAPGMGWWLRTNHEVLLIGTTNGNAHPNERVESVVEHPVGRHSEKPSVFREDIERCHDGPRVELFARARADGWDSWGNEV